MGRSKKRQCNLKKSCTLQPRPSAPRKPPPRPKKPESRAIFSTKVETWRSHGEKAYCPICKKSVVPVVLEKRRRVTSSGFAAICLLGCWPLCALLPLKGDTSALLTRCPVCGYEYRSLDRVKVISPSKASSTSTLSNTRDVSHRLVATQIKSHSQRAMELHDAQGMEEIDSKKYKSMESAWVQTHHAVEKIDKIDDPQSSDGCGCRESTDINEKQSTYQIVEQFNYYRHQHKPLISSECKFSHHNCNPQLCINHDTNELPTVTMSHEESTFHLIENTSGYRDDRVRKTNSIVYSNKNCRESTCNEVGGYNCNNWTDDDCGIAWVNEESSNRCCQGRFQGDDD